MARRRISYERLKEIEAEQRAPFTIDLQGPVTGDAELAIRALMRKAKAARGDLSLFYQMVMRHELTGKPLIPAPHQKCAFSFVEHHDRCVLRQPIGTGKTFGATAITLWLIGNDVTQRGGVISKAQFQSQKVVGQVADYIMEPALNAALILVFPWLQRSTRPQDAWTQTALTVDRPPGIRDPSLVAVGVDGAIAGARLSWIVADDTIDDDNSRTPKARDKTQSNFDGKILSRLDPYGSKAIVTNTPWNREDLTYHLEKNAGWPTITMDIYGNIRFTNADPVWLRMAEKELVRPSLKRGDGWYRLRAFDPDPNEETPLWPDRYSLKRIQELRYGRNNAGGMRPQEFARLFLCEPFDEEASRCQRSWIDCCKKRGMGTTLISKYTGHNPTYTAVDLGIGTGSKHDLTVFFTFERERDGTRRILDIESGRFSGPDIVSKLINKVDRYGSIVAVETNSAQDFIRQFAQEKRKDLRIRSHNTQGANKHDIDFGVESVFTEMQNGAWVIPCDDNGNCHSEVQAWIDEMLYYQPPPAHTGDRLMACWIGRETSRRGGGGRDPKPRSGGRLTMSNSGGF